MKDQTIRYFFVTFTYTVSGCHGVGNVTVEIQGKLNNDSLVKFIKEKWGPANRLNITNVVFMGYPYELTKRQYEEWNFKE